MMKNMRNETKFFGRGIASGEGFCNRTSEVQKIINNIDDITHTLLISPRRYGKTSLVLRAIEKSGLPYAHIDLFMKYDTDVILEEFYQEVSRLILKVIKPTERALKKLGSVLKNLVVSLQHGSFGIEFKLEPKTVVYKKDLKQLLLDVDEFLEQQKQKIVLFIDEMQTITDTEICSDIESALRFVAQKTRHIVFIFSGSSRHLMSQLFEERNRPFYKLCQKMTLNRMTTEHYRCFIDKVAEKRWGEKLSVSVYEAIFELAQLHPYYMNVLCHYLFESDIPPDQQAVLTCWQTICREEQGSVAKDIDFLSKSQKILLSEIARSGCVKQPTGKDFIKRVNLSPRGVSLALATLLQYDLIEQREDGAYRIIDPAIHYWARS